jgi:p38 MAP kinase
VCEADDSVTGEKVAIKKLAQPFATEIHAKRVYREIKLLKHVSQNLSHDNIIQLYDLFSQAASPAELKDMLAIICLFSNSKLTF